MTKISKIDLIITDVYIVKHNVAFSENIQKEMNINLVPYSHDTFSPETGGYFLVRTVSNVLKTVRMFSAHVSKTWDSKNEKFVFSIDVSGQKVTHISEHPIK